MTVEVRGRIESSSAYGRLLWKDGWIGGTSDLLARIELVAMIDGLNLDNREDFVTAVLRSFERRNVKMEID
jgi:hypothetical protein